MRLTNGSPHSVPRRPISSMAVLGRTATSNPSMRGCVMSSSMARSSIPCVRPRSSSRAGDATTMRSGHMPRWAIALLHARGLCAGACCVAGCATSISCAGHASFAHATKPKLTSYPDHSVGADQPICAAKRRRRTGRGRDCTLNPDRECSIRCPTHGARGNRGGSKALATEYAGISPDSPLHRLGHSTPEQGWAPVPFANSTRPGEAPPSMLSTSSDHRYAQGKPGFLAVDAGLDILGKLSTFTPGHW